MAADWRGWRLIVVNGKRFRWRKTWEGDARVRPESRPGRLLIIRGGFADAVPGVVRQWIEVTDALGWPAAVPELELRVAD
jgi:hypothetical protein